MFPDTELPGEREEANNDFGVQLNLKSCERASDQTEFPATAEERIDSVCADVNTEAFPMYMAWSATPYKLGSLDIKEEAKLKLFTQWLPAKGSSYYEGTPQLRKNWWKAQALGTRKVIGAQEGLYLTMGVTNAASSRGMRMYINSAMMMKGAVKCVQTDSRMIQAESDSEYFPCGNNTVSGVRGDLGFGNFEMGDAAIPPLVANTDKADKHILAEYFTEGYKFTKVKVYAPADLRVGVNGKLNVFPTTSSSPAEIEKWLKEFAKATCDRVGVNMYPVEMVPKTDATNTLGVPYARVKTTGLYAFKTEATDCVCGSRQYLNALRLKRDPQRTLESELEACYVRFSQFLSPIQLVKDGLVPNGLDGPNVRLNGATTADTAVGDKGENAFQKCFQIQGTHATTIGDTQCSSSEKKPSLLTWNTADPECQRIAPKLVTTSKIAQRAARGYMPNGFSQKQDIHRNFCSASSNELISTRINADDVDKYPEDEDTACTANKKYSVSDTLMLGHHIVHQFPKMTVSLEAHVFDADSVFGPSGAQQNKHVCRKTKLTCDKDDDDDVYRWQAIGLSDVVQRSIGTKQVDPAKKYTLIRKTSGDHKDASGLNGTLSTIPKFDAKVHLLALIENDNIEYEGAMLNGHSDELFKTHCGKLSWHSSVLQSQAINQDTRFVHVVESVKKPSIPFGYERIPCGGCKPFGDSNTASGRRLLSMQAAAAKRTRHKPRRILVNFDINKKKVAQRRLLSINDASLPDVISQIMFANNIQSVVAGTASSGAAASSVTFKGSSTISDVASGTAHLQQWMTDNNLMNVTTKTSSSSSDSTGWKITAIIFICIVAGIFLFALLALAWRKKDIIVPWMKMVWEKSKTCCCRRSGAESENKNAKKKEKEHIDFKVGAGYSTKGLGKKGNITIKL
jgi:hypothetical protein